MRRRDFLRTLGCGATAAAMPGFGLRASQENGRPNILFVFADDQCFETLHALGNTEVKTPNLDKLVRRGVTFTHAYNQGAWGGAVCVASRAMLNTGRFLWSAHGTLPTMDDECAQGRFWSQYMADAGYDTYMTGKWHVKVPANKVFDVTKDVRGGMPNQTPEGYNRPIEGEPDPWSPYDPKFGGYWTGGKHWSEVLGDNAVEFLDQSAASSNPFFMYLAFNAPHDPRQSPKEYVDKYPLENVKVPENFLPEYPWNEEIGCGRKLRDEALAPFPRTEYAVKVNRQEYYAIITHMDEQIGRILDALEKTGKADNTYIFFTADHGLAVGHHGLMGKQNLFDHSVRVPLMVVGPDVPADKRIAAPVYLQDIMPSTLELAGVARPPQVQFRSLMPLIDGRREKNYDAIYGGYTDRQRMVCDGDYKLLYYPVLKKTLLFNLKSDPLEMNDLAANPEYAGKIQELRGTLTALQKETGDALALD